MREGGKKLRRLGLAALFMLAASAAAAQSQQLAIGQRNLACGSPDVSRRRLADRRHRRASASMARAFAASRRGSRKPMPTFMPWSSSAMASSSSSNISLAMTSPGARPDGQHDFDATTKHDMRSVSKSVISLLVGIAIDRKLIKSADEPVLKFFPDYAAVKSPGWDNITLRHLLTMSSGMQWDENRAWKDPEERRAASQHRSRSVPLCPVEADRGAAGHASGPIMAAERTCSATSSSASRASRLKPLRAKRCSSRSAFPTGNG